MKKGMIARQLEISSRHDLRSGDEFARFISLVQSIDLIRWARTKETRELRPDDTGKPPKLSKYFRDAMVGMIP